MPGLSHLAAKTPGIHCIPLAIEYVFRDQRLPMLLCKLGSSISDRHLVESNSKADWHATLTGHLRATQSQLAEKVIDARWDDFEVMVRAADRPEGIYDWMRWMVRAVTGQSRSVRHGESFR